MTNSYFVVEKICFIHRLNANIKHFLYWNLVSVVTFHIGSFCYFSLLYLFHGHIMSWPLSPLSYVVCCCAWSVPGRLGGAPVVHLGPVASGRQVVGNEVMRQEFASQLGIVAFDAEFDSVVESVFGSRKDSYMFIRGVAGG